MRSTRYYGFDSCADEHVNRPFRGREKGKGAYVSRQKLGVAVALSCARTGAAFCFRRGSAG